MFRDLPKKEQTFAFREEGDVTMQTYEGEFTVRAILNVGQKHQLELEKTILQADSKAPTAGLSGISNVLAELRVRIISGPEWWENSRGGATIDDENVLLALYTQVLDTEIEWRNSLRKKTTDAVEKTGEADKDDPNSQGES